MLMLDTLVIALNVSSLCFIPLLPPQKRDLQALVASGQSSPRIARTLLVALGLCFLWSMTGNLLAIFPSTACLAIIGGPGC